MQAKLGDVICPKVKTETDKVVVSLDNIEGKAYAILEFLKNKWDIWVKNIGNYSVAD